MPDDRTTIGELKAAVREFCDARNWEPFHSPKNLVMALAVEVAELMEPMRWVEGDASRKMIDDPEMRQALAEELADVTVLLLNLSLALKLDVSDSVRAKMVKNAVKYPAPSGTPERSGG